MDTVTYKEKGQRHCTLYLAVLIMPILKMDMEYYAFSIFVIAAFSLSSMRADFKTL